MEHLIKFRMLVDNLNEYEFQKFILQFIKDYGTTVIRRLITRAIFNEFAKTISTSQQNGNAVEKDYFCKCEHELSPIKDKSDIYSKNSRINCDECNKAIKRGNKFWHCLKESAVHKNGFDICRLCIHKYEKNSFRRNKVVKINAIIAKLINSRGKNKGKPKQSPTMITTAKKLDELPPELISHTASFLSTFQFIALQNCNRASFIGCNTPFSLQRLDVSECKNLEDVPWSKLRLITSLHLNNIRTLLSSMRGVRFQNIKNLSIDLRKSLTAGFDLPTFGQSRIIDFGQVEQLTLQNIRSRARTGGINYNYLMQNTGIVHMRDLTPLTPTKLIRFLRSLPNLKYLNIRYIAMRNDDYDQTVKLVLPKLTHIKRYGISDIFWRYLRENCGKQITTFDHRVNLGNRQSSNRSFGVSLGCMPNLKRLTIRDPDVDTLGYILKTSNLLLTELHVKNIDSMENGVRVQIAGILQTHKHLDFISFSDHSDHFEASSSQDSCKQLFDHLEHGLYKSDQLRRDSFRIELYLKSIWDDDEIEDLMTCMRRLILQLSACNIGNFVMLCRIERGESQANERKISDYFKQKYQIQTFISDEHETFIISSSKPT